MKRVLANLSQRQKVTIAVVTLIAAAGIYALVHRQKEADFRPLFTGVSAEDANGIVQRLKDVGVEYRLR
jgi:flagellar biosynthesis/type III secretory pathway M-ring protein FliF/YscJ